MYDKEEPVPLLDLTSRWVLLMDEKELNGFQLAVRKGTEYTSVGPVISVFPVGATSPGATRPHITLTVVGLVDSGRTAMNYRLLVAAFRGLVGKKPKWMGHFKGTLSDLDQLTAATCRDPAQVGMVEACLRGGIASYAVVCVCLCVIDSFGDRGSGSCPCRWCLS